MMTEQKRIRDRIISVETGATVAYSENGTKITITQVSDKPIVDFYVQGNSIYFIQGDRRYEFDLLGARSAIYDGEFYTMGEGEVKGDE